MPFIQECSDFDIRNNQITVVEGSQHNTIYDNCTLQIMRQGRRELSIWDEAVGTSDIYDDDGPRYNRNRRTVARRTISIARIRGEDKEAEFLYVRYSGPGARQAFKRDFDQFSVVKHLNVAQLFGYSDSQYNLPALIFYDALIPLNRVLLSNDNRWVELYFRLQVAVAGIDGGFFGTDPNILWIEPRSGALRRGPYVQSNAYPLRQLVDVPSTSHLDPLSIQTYSDTNTVIDYLARIFPIDMIFKEVETRVKSQLQRVTALEPWPYLLGSLWKRGQQSIIARWTGLTQIPQYVCIEARDSRFRRCGTVMEDGSVRLQSADPTDREHLDTESAWLVQAHSIFNQLGIHEDEWKDYSIINYFSVLFDPIKVRTYRAESTDTASNRPTSYFFVRPIPRLSDDETTWRSWVESTYFWSFDPSGQEEISESMRVSLGLPVLKTEINFGCRSWDVETYKVMERPQHFKGFDPKTTDFARSLGYPLMQVVGDKDWVQELGVSNKVLRHSLYPVRNRLRPGS
ncbi:hypothetical protein Moror_11590 [Moniliophthora roreri MCA 2997]|uniref:Protein kinase domain-containing protein n=1 Tax=Moniliophthora roreri (strain MCA 2997) TaxID=1381753 RepID=V2X4U7_MONRO|nr:hypothetical protein Moror_11590 [Moniliophthora roreri MCA 2997]